MADRRRQRSFDRVCFGEIGLQTPPGNPRRKNRDCQRRDETQAVKRPCDRVVRCRTGACAQGLACHGPDVGIGCAGGQKPDKGCEGEPPKGDLNESGRIADKAVRNNRRHAANQDDAPTLSADRSLQSSELCAVTELPPHPVPCKISACKKIDRGSNGRTDGDQSRAEPEAVNGPRANRKYRPRQKKYTSQCIKYNEPHDAGPAALLDPLQRVVEKFC